MQKVGDVHDTSLRCVPSTTFGFFSACHVNPFHCALDDVPMLPVPTQKDGEVHDTDVRFPAGLVVRVNVLPFHAAPREPCTEPAAMQKLVETHETSLRWMFVSVACATFGTLTTIAPMRAIIPMTQRGRTRERT